MGRNPIEMMGGNFVGCNFSVIDRGSLTTPCRKRYIGFFNDPLCESYWGYSFNVVH